MTKLSTILNEYHTRTQTECEKVTCFKQLIQCYLSTGPSYADLYDKVWMYGDWTKELDINAQYAGIELVARTHDAMQNGIQFEQSIARRGTVICG